MRARLRLLPLLVLAGAAAALAPRAEASVAAPSAVATAPVRPLIVTGTLAAASTRAPEAIARDVVATHASWTRGLELRAARTFAPVDGTRIVAFEQTIDGVPVLARGARVAIEADGRASALSTALEERRPSSTVPSVSESFAIDVARRAIGLVAPGTRAHLVVAPQGPGAEPRLAWAIGGGLAQLPTRPAALVDARTGELLQTFERAVHERQANVYEFNPVASPMLKTTTLASTNDVTTPGLDNAMVTSRNCIDNKSVKSIMGITAHVCDLVPTVTANAAGDYTDVMPADDHAPEDAYAELSMFYHTDKAYQHAKDLGFLGTNKLTAVGNLRIPQGFDTFDLQKIGDPNLPLAPYDNAMFAPDDPLFSQVFGISGDAMWFGQGTFIDFGYDGDVVYHEFGHYVVSQTAKLVATPHVDKYGVSVSPGALNEGLADINSFFISGDPCTGEYASKGITTDACIRNATNTQKMPDALVGEVHQDSNPFSAATWKVYSALDATKRQTFQKAWLKGLMMVPSGDVGYGDLADVLVAAITQNVDTTTGDALRQSFDERGMKKDDPRVRTYAGAPIQSIVPQLGFFALGTQTVGGSAKLAPGIFQVKYDAPAGGTVTLHAHFSMLSLGGGSSPFGGGGTKFTPVLLAKAGGDPILFQWSPFSHDAVEGTCTVSGSTATCDATVTTTGTPGGTAPVHLMIASTGQQDGNYDALTITSDPLVPAPTPQPADDAGTGSQDQPATGAAAEGGGCGCELPGEHTSSKGAFGLGIAGALAALVVARRRR